MAWHMSDPLMAEQLDQIKKQSDVAIVTSCCCKSHYIGLSSMIMEDIP